jgi:hypothetical protein
MNAFETFIGKVSRLKLEQALFNFFQVVPQKCRIANSRRYIPPLHLLGSSISNTNAQKMTDRMTKKAVFMRLI